MNTSRSLADWLAELELRHPKSIDLGLDRVGRVAATLGLHQCFATVITVGGTNGKGSTVTTLDCILQADAKKTGRYLSPHLERFNERVAINGVEVADEVLVAAFEQVEAARGDVSLTYFEFTTLAALDVFRQSQVDVVLLEVGLGGRLDAVNVIDSDVAIVTSIGLDHTDWLGPDRESIGFEKAGIFRTGKPAICGDREPPSSVVHQAEKKGALLSCKGAYFDYAVNEGAWTFSSAQRELRNLPVPAVALENAATAVAAITALPWHVPDEAIAQGLKVAAIAGRHERIVDGGIEIIFDVAHNPHGAHFFMNQLRTGRGRCHAVFAMLRDKDIPGTIDECLGRIDCWYPASLHVPRGENASLLASCLLERGALVEKAFVTVSEALSCARLKASPGDTILVFGSFYTVGEARGWLRTRQGEF